MSEPVTVTSEPAAAAPVRTVKLYRRIAELVGQRKRCIETNNTVWRDRSEETMEKISRNLLPSGAGIDSGTTIDLDKSTEDKLVLHTSYHHMNDGGYYDGWTEHTITVRPSLTSDFNLSISGRNRNEIKDYLADVFNQVLREETAL